jgi:hypothetical protein
MAKVVRTNEVNRSIAAMIRQNGSKFFNVTFKKKDGTMRTLNCNVRKVPGHGKGNSVSHFEKYVTVVLSQPDDNGKAQFRNVNVESIQSLSIGGRKISFN